jgi:hypothetical protein
LKVKSKKEKQNPNKTDNGTIVVPNYVIYPKYVRKLLAVDLSDFILNSGIYKDTGGKIHPSAT